jgi:hypothetical protein
MNEAVHQLLQLILQGLTWVFKTIETLWVWSWSQIGSVFGVSWGDLPGWKLALALVAVLALLAILAVLFMRGFRAFQRIAAAFWTMAITMIGILTFVVVAGLLSRGVTWVVASVPDDFWQKLL